MAFVAFIAFIADARAILQKAATDRCMDNGVSYSENLSDAFVSDI